MSKLSPSRFATVFPKFRTTNDFLFFLRVGTTKRFRVTPMAANGTTTYSTTEHKAHVVKRIASTLFACTLYLPFTLIGLASWTFSKAHKTAHKDYSHFLANPSKSIPVTPIPNPAIPTPPPLPGTLMSPINKKSLGDAQRVLHDAKSDGQKEAKKLAKHLSSITTILAESHEVIFVTHNQQGAKDAARSSFNLTRNICLYEKHITPQTAEAYRTTLAQLGELVDLNKLQDPNTNERIKIFLEGAIEVDKEAPGQNLTEAIWNALADTPRAQKALRQILIEVLTETNQLRQLVQLKISDVHEAGEALAWALHDCADQKKREKRITQFLEANTDVVPANLINNPPTVTVENRTLNKLAAEIAYAHILRTLDTDDQPISINNQQVLRQVMSKIANDHYKDIEISQYGCAHLGQLYKRDNGCHSIIINWLGQKVTDDDQRLTLLEIFLTQAKPSDIGALAKKIKDKKVAAELVAIHALSQKGSASDIVSQYESCEEGARTHFAKTLAEQCKSNQIGAITTAVASSFKAASLGPNSAALAKQLIAALLSTLDQEKVAQAAAAIAANWAPLNDKSIVKRKTALNGGVEVRGALVDEGQVNWFLEGIPQKSPALKKMVSFFLDGDGLPLEDSRLKVSLSTIKREDLRAAIRAIPRFKKLKFAA